MNHLDWDDLRLFLAFVRSGGTRSAAKSLGVSHSTVARRLETMQERAGARFFERREGSPVLTLAGRDILETAERVENEVLGLQRRAFGLDRALEGPLTLTMIDAFATDRLMGVFSSFRKQHPSIDLRIDISLSIANLDRREADLALRFGVSPDDHLVGRRLVDTARAVYATRDYVNTHWPEPLSTDAGWISFSGFSESEKWKNATTFGALPTHIRLVDMRAQLAACRAGLGIAYLPCFLCDEDPALVRISEPDFPKHQRLWLIRHADTDGNIRVRTLSDFLAKAFKELTPFLRGETSDLVSV